MSCAVSWSLTVRMVTYGVSWCRIVSCDVSSNLIVSYDVSWCLYAVSWCLMVYCDVSLSLMVSSLMVFNAISWSLMVDR